jgi:hypothetical protein
MQRKQLLGIANRVERSGARKSLERGVLALASLVAFGFVGYGAYAGITWFRYGRIDRPVTPHEIDPLLDRFIPVYETAERHHIRVHAPAAITLEAAKASDMNDSAVVRAIFETREIVFRATPDDTSRPRGILAQMRAIGWGVLAEIPDREIVMGAVTQPWKGDVVFRALPPDEFASFHEPGYVKIVWTLRADALGPAESMAITETRVTNTDAFARENFRRYWAFVSPGVVLIRHMSLRLVRRDAEQRYRAADKTTVKIVPPDGGTSM